MFLHFLQDYKVESAVSTFTTTSREYFSELLLFYIMLEDMCVFDTLSNSTVAMLKYI